MAVKPGARLSVKLWSIRLQLLHISLLWILEAEAQVLRLEIEPQVEALCPGDQLLLRCWHNATYNEPDWRVMNGSVEIYRSINFQGSTLEGHTVINSTTVLEVLQIGPIQHAFNGLRYSCVYDTTWGERQSNEVTVKLHEPPVVRDLTALIHDSTTVGISWEQDDDACSQATTPLLHINGSRAAADCKPMQQSRFECIVPSLTPETQYTLDVYITTGDGRKSATATSVAFETDSLLGGTQPPQSSEGVITLCTTEPVACGLYSLTGVFALILLLMVIISLTVCVRWSRQGKGQIYDTA